MTEQATERDRQATLDHVRRQYIHGCDHEGALIFPSLAELCREHAVPYSTARRYKDREDWDAQRMAFREEVTEETDRRIAQMIASRRSEFERKTFEISEELATTIQKAIDAEQEKATPNYQALRQLSAAAAIMAKIGGSTLERASGEAERARELDAADAERDALFQNMDPEDRKTVLEIIDRARSKARNATAEPEEM